MQRIHISKTIHSILLHFLKWQEWSFLPLFLLFALPLFALFYFIHFEIKIMMNQLAFSDAQVADTVLSSLTSLKQTLGVLFIFCLASFLMLSYGCMKIFKNSYQWKKEIHNYILKQKELVIRSKVEFEQLELFSFLASHDLQEPLYKIISFIDLMKSNHTFQINEKILYYFERILKACQKMSQIINRIHDFSKILITETRFESINLSQTAMDALHELDHLIKQKYAIIEINFLPIIQGNALQLLQLFINLIGNSLKFSSPERTPFIHISSRQINAEWIEISIKDNGVGFDENYKHKLFQPFQRLHSTDYEGTGLGLAICQKIMLKHGGSISAQSEINKGTTIYLIFPFLQENV